MSILNKVPVVLRILMGLPFVVFGLNGFLGFIPQPPLSGEAGAFLGALAASGYVFPLVKGIEVLAGIALLSNRFVPLALVVLAPIQINITAFHVLMAPDGSGLAIFLLLIHLFLAWTYRDAFRGVLAARVAPAPLASETRVLQTAR